MNDELDPFQSYEIRTLNPTYSGEAFGVDFQKGRAVVYALPQGSPPEEVMRRKRMLLEMRNTGEGTRRVEDETGIRNVTGPVYEITPWAPEQRIIKAKAS